VLPAIVPGWAGNGLTVTDKVLAGPVPQALVADTDMVPPAEPTVAVMKLVVELPLHPDGKVHVYEVAPVTAAILYVCDDP
jgi:hypothetical protein